MKNKKLNMFDLVALGYGGTIGSGIFVILGFAIAYTGRSAALVIPVGIIFMFLAYIYQVIMPSMYDFNGGDYEMQSMVFPVGITGMKAYFQVASATCIATYGISVVDYAASIFPAVAPYGKLVSVVLMTVLFLISIKGQKAIATVNSVMTVVLMVALAAFIVFGLPKVKWAGFFGDGFVTNGFGGFISAVAIMSWTCQGTTNGALSQTSVVDNPKKKIPLSAIYTAISVCITYVLITVVAVGVLPIEEVAGQNLSLVAEEIMPHNIYVLFIIGGACFALLTSLCGCVVGYRFQLHKIATDGWLPKFCTKTTKDGYPWVIMLLIWFFSVLPVFIGLSLETIVSLCMIPTMVLCLYMNFNVIRLIREDPEAYANSPIRMPLPLTKALCILGCVCDIVIGCQLFADLSGRDMILMVVVVAACVVLGLWRVKSGAVNVEELNNRKNAAIAAAKASRETASK